MRAVLLQHQVLSTIHKDILLMQYTCKSSSPTLSSSETFFTKSSCMAFS
uniref:Uncharacterized protein n=1 Tax=Amphimedon queenslandica TaxID=400682 RepID=A0A1X7VPW0_AMPQE